MTDEQKKEQLRKFFSDEGAKKKFEQELQNYKGVEPDLDTMYKIAGNVIAKDVKGTSYDSIEKPNTVEFPVYKFDAMGNRYDRDYADYPEFKVEGNSIKIAGSPAYLKSDVVQEAKKAITDYYKGYDLTNNQVAENIQKTIDEVNAQVKSNLQYQEYNDFLQKSNFSDEAYRNYALAKQDADPKTTTNLLKSKNKYKGYKKDGSMDELTAKEWLEYWKKEYTPEERIQLWMDSSDALARAESDEDLYKGLAYILMGAEEKQNVPAGVLNAINPFNDKGYEDAKFYGPIYGFDDISSGDKWKAFWDAFLSTNREALGRLVKWAGGQTEPLQRALGGRYGTTDVSTPEKWGKTVGIDGVTFDTINMSKKEWNKVANLVNKYFGNSDKNTRNRLLEEGTEAEILARYEGKDMAAKILWVRDFSKLPSTGDREKGWNAFQSFKNNYELRQSEGYKSPYEKWGAEREREMQKHIERLSTIAPNATTWGMIGGTVARIAAEQAALGALSSGSLTAQNVAKTLTQGGWKLTGNVLDAIGVGQNVASKSANLTAAITALAGAGGAGLTGASKALYALGSIGTWAVREMGEDVLRGLVDDAVTANSFDSQGNLDPTKLAENVYMNAIMYGAAKGIKGAAKGLAAIVDNAKTRNIDGVELNVNQRNQINLFQKALDDQNTRYQFRGYDSNGHPVITVGGKTKVLDQLTPSGETAKAIEDATGAASPTATRTAESLLDDQDVSNDVKQKISEVIQTAKDGDAEDIKVKIQESLTDDEIRQAFPDGTMKVGDQTIRIDTKDFTAGDVGRVTGKEYETMEEAIEGLSKAVTTRDFASAINGIMRYSVDWAKNFKEAVQSFAEANNMAVRDVMIAIRDSRIAGKEVIPGLKQLWEENWKPIQTRLLDLEEQFTGVRPTEHDFYFRDMIEGTYVPGLNGAYSINQGSVVDALGGDADFDLAASSTARNTGRLAEIAADRLEYDPEVLAREYVSSRMQSIWQSDNMGKVYATLQEAHDAGEFGLTETEAAQSVGAVETVAREVGDSEGVKEIENLSNVAPLDEEFGKPVTIESDGDVVKSSTGKTGEEAVEEMASLNKKQIVDAQKKFNESASKSNAAEQISKNSGYKNRSIRVNPGPVVGVNYMPSNPFGKFAQWINDHFVKANSIKMRFGGYDAAGNPAQIEVTAYNGGYKMYAEAGTFARNVIVDIQRGDSMYDAIYKQIRNNGFFIEPSDWQKTRYGALTANEQAARVADGIMDKINKDKRFSYAFNADGTVRDTAAVLSILTTRFRGQGISDFTKFIRKADWDSLTKGEQSWLNKRMYEMTASVNKKSFATIAGHIAKFSMGLRYRSNMWFNYKNGQLQLTECQRLFTMNKIGDFNRTLKRLVSDPEYRQKVSDYTYIHAAESVGRGLSRADLDKSADAAVKVGAASTISKNGIFTNIDDVKAKFGDIDDTALASIEGAEYAKNYILIAGFVAAGEKQGLEGAELDTYVRNRFNTEALAGTRVGKIGLTDSKIGQFAFMYLGFPIRELALQWHTIRGGGLRKDFLGSVEYLSKMLGAKGLMWAAEAPWGYSLMDQLDLDPFGWTDQYSQMPNEPGERTPFWGGLDVAIQYNPFFQGAMTSAMADIYFAYRAAQETAREEYKAEHNGSAEGFEWSLADAGGEMWHDLIKGLTPGYTEYSRIAEEVTDLDRGYRISATGNRLYQPNTDPGNVFWAMLSGSRNTPNAQDYYHTASPIRGVIEGGIPGLGQNILRGINPFRGFREFDPTDSETYSDWFDGTYADQQNWNTGIYAFRDEAQQIKEKYDKYAQAGTAVNDAAARENELAELRNRVETYVNAYISKHPEGISSAKQNQIINIFNLGQFQPTLNEAFAESQGQADYSDWDAAKNRYSQGNFPTAYGLKQDDEGETSYVRSPLLEQVLSQQRYGIASDVAPTIEQMYKTPKFDTPLGSMTMKDYHDKVYAQLQEEWNKDKPDYDKITKAQEEYLEYISKNVIQPILNTYGSTVLSAGKSSDIMQEFGKMLYSMVPSDEYRIDKKGKQIYKSTPYMTIDIPKWLNKNFTKYTESVNTTNRATKDRIQSIRDSIDQGHRSTAVAKVRALIRDIGQGKASVSRDELEWLQGVLND